MVFVKECINKEVLNIDISNSKKEKNIINIFILTKTSLYKR